MKKRVLLVSVACFFASAAFVYAGAAFGPKDFAKGKLCCVNDVCVMVKSDEDCAKIGGKPVTSCKECGKSQTEAGKEKAK